MRAKKIFRVACQMAGINVAYDTVKLDKTEKYELRFYAHGDKDLPLCAIVRSILIDRVPCLCQALK